MPNGFGVGNEVGSSKDGAPSWSSTHRDTAGGHGSAPDAAAPHQREIQAPAGASPGFRVVISATPSSCHGELMGSTHGTMGAACPPCWAGSVGAGEEDSERLGKRARDGCQKKENKNKGGRSSFTFCSCHPSVLANLVGGGKGKKTANPACPWREDYCTGKKESKRVWS